MKKTLFLVVAGALAGCGSDGTNTPSTPTLDSPSAISTYLEGKTLTMEGNNIPTSPNGFNENMNIGAATQCYNKTSISILSGIWNVNTLLGTLKNAPNFGDVGTCDRTTVAGNALTFSSTNVLIENVQNNGSCFDVTVTYTGFGQEGRAAFSADGKTLTMELFFSGQATGHRCANGAVGAPTVSLKGVAFTGDAKQVYVVQ